MVESLTSLWTLCGGNSPGDVQFMGSPPTSTRQITGLLGPLPGRNNLTFWGPPSPSPMSCKDEPISSAPYGVHGHSSSVAVRSRPRYLKGVTVSSGFPYAWKSVISPTHASSSASHRLLLSVTCMQSVVVGWWWFSAAYGTNMSQVGHRGWGWLPSSIITIVS